MPSSNSTPLVLLFSLADNARTKLPDWYGDVCSQARNLCAQHERTGALTLVARTNTWNSYHIPRPRDQRGASRCRNPPSNLRSPLHVGLAKRSRGNHTQRGVFPLPGRRPVLARNHAYAAATSTLAQALLTSIGPDNKVSLEATFDPDPLYLLTPRQIVDTMFAEHGMTNPQDLAVLRAPLHEPLLALANLERHMNLFLLASKILTTVGQGKTPYEYFELFLETLKGFTVVGHCLPAYFAVNTTMATRNLS
jgi:hypothetical protein